jgi:FtsP/CotA-like multicopper oxidase with cupredoxin domain
MARGRLLALLVALVVLTACNAGRPSTGVDDSQAMRPLAIPPLLEGTLGPDGVRRYSLTAQSGTTDFGDGRVADTIGLNQAYLGPTLRMVRGEDVEVEVRNTLPEMTTLHWHGMHVPAQDDGGPHQMIAPGETWRPSWTIDQPAGTLWYHSHPHGQTAQQVYRGLAGMLLIEDAAAPAGLPDRYGIDDVPVIVQDKTFDDTGQLVVDPQGSATTGFLGRTLVVNGTIDPYLEVSTELVRLRLLNASNARSYNFGLSDGRDFDLIATDGGFLEQPYRTDRIQLTPGERAEMVVAVQPGETLSLRSYDPDLGSRIGSHHKFGSGEFSVLELRAAASLAGGTQVPQKLSSIERFDPAGVATERTFRIQGHAINGRPMMMARIDEVVTVGQVELWSVLNADPQPHNFHIHNVQFQVLDIDGAPPPPQLAGWKDTVYVPPRTTVRLIMRFEDHTDPTWPYMFHCHLLLHEDIGIMGQFVVVQPGEQAIPPMVRNTNALGQSNSRASGRQLEQGLKRSMC